MSISGDSDDYDECTIRCLIANLICQIGCYTAFSISVLHGVYSWKDVIVENWSMAVFLFAFFGLFVLFSVTRLIGTIRVLIIVWREQSLRYIQDDHFLVRLNIARLICIIVFLVLFIFCELNAVIHAIIYVKEARLWSLIIAFAGIFGAIFVFGIIKSISTLRRLLSDQSLRNIPCIM